MKKINPENGKIETWIPLEGDLTIVTFDVDGIWKGPVTPVMRVFSTVHPAMCDGYEFGLGSRYTVFADRLAALVPGLSRSNTIDIFDAGVCPGPNIPGPLESGTALLGKVQKTLAR